MRDDITRALAIVCAVVAGCALVLQMILLAHQFFIQKQGPVAAAWRFFADFVLLSNLLAFIVSLRAAVRPQDITGMGAPATHLTAAAALISGAAVYFFILREVLPSEGLQRMAEVLLHIIMPLAFTLFFLLRTQTGLHWRHAIWSLIWPAAYCSYAMARGASDGWYTFWFLNASQLTLWETTLNAALFCGGFLVIALALTALRLALGSRA